MKDGDALFGMVDYCHVKAMAMRWRTRDLRKAGIIVAGVLLLLGLMAWVPLSVASAHQVTPGVTAPGTVTVQATPTVDATVTALSDFHYSLVDPRLIDFLETVRAQDEEILDQIALDLALDLHSEMGLEPHF